MTVTGSTFDRMRVTPANDALLNYYLANQVDNRILGYKNELAITTSGLNVYVNTGAAIIQGRLVEVTEMEQITVPANSAGGYICLTIDLTQFNQATGVPGEDTYIPTNNQVRLERVDVLTQQALNNGGQIFTFPLASYTSNGTTVTVVRTGINMRNEIAQVMTPDVTNAAAGTTMLNTTFVTGTTSPLLTQGSQVMSVNERGYYRLRCIGEYLSGSSWRRVSIDFKRGSTIITPPTIASPAGNAGAVLSCEVVIYLEKGDTFQIKTQGGGIGNFSYNRCYVEKL